MVEDEIEKCLLGMFMSICFGIDLGFSSSLKTSKMCFSSLNLYIFEYFIPTCTYIYFKYNMKF